MPIETIRESLKEKGKKKEIKKYLKTHIELTFCSFSLYYFCKYMNIFLLLIYIYIYGYCTYIGEVHGILLMCIYTIILSHKK